MRHRRAPGPSKLFEAERRIRQSRMTAVGQANAIFKIWLPYSYHGNYLVSLPRAVWRQMADVVKITIVRVEIEAIAHIGAGRRCTALCPGLRPVLIAC